MQPPVSRPIREGGKTRCLHIAIQRRMVLQELLIMRAIAGTGRVIHRNNQTGIITANTAGCLNIFCIRFRLAGNYHCTQTPHINAYRNHVRCQQIVKYIRMVILGIAAFQLNLDNFCDFGITHAARQFFCICIPLGSIYAGVDRHKFSFCKIIKTALNVVKDLRTCTAQFSQAVEITCNSPEIIHNCIRISQCGQIARGKQHSCIHSDQRCGCSCSDAHYAKILTGRLFFRCRLYSKE